MNPENQAKPNTE